MVCCAGGCYGEPFKSHRGVTQGGLFSPRIFNVMVDVISREWLCQVFGADAAKLGMGRDIAQFLAILSMSMMAKSWLDARRDCNFQWSSWLSCSSTPGFSQMQRRQKG